MDAPRPSRLTQIIEHAGAELAAHDPGLRRLGRMARAQAAYLREIAPPRRFTRHGAPPAARGTAAR